MIAGSMNWIDKNLLTCQQNTFLDELVRQQINATVTIWRYTETPTSTIHRLDVKVGPIQYIVRFQEENIHIKNSIKEEINTIYTEVAVTHIKLTANQELDKKIKYLIKEKEKFNDYNLRPAGSGGTMKIVINSCFGGFSISKKAAEYMAERGHDQATQELKEMVNKFYGYGYSEKYTNEYKRNDPILIEAVEILGEATNGCCARLKIVEIPDDIEWEIEEYDGREHIAEKHRTWY